MAQVNWLSIWKKLDPYLKLYFEVKSRYSGGLNENKTKPKEQKAFETLRKNVQKTIFMTLT